MKVRLTIREIASVVGGQVIGVADAEVRGVSTDSRTVKPGELFVPLVGERFDGHDFINGALNRGVQVFLAERRRISTADLQSGHTCIIVDDTLRALGDLAAFHRGRFSLPVIAVTGSNGKTTTKEMLAGILSRTGTGLKTAGNLNNLVGLPQMLFQLTEQHQWAVLEMGMSEPGEIDRLAEIARPDVGIITNVSPAHLQTMGSVGAIAQAKGELFMRLGNGCLAVFNGDDPLVAGLPSPDGVRRLSFGLGEAEVRAKAVEELGRSGQQFSLCLPSGTVPVRMQVFGCHNILNALAAAAAAYAVGVSPDVIRDGLESFQPFEKRFAPEDLGGVLLIDDSYNANPASMRAALVTVKRIKEEGRGIAVLGDMLELGEAAVASHEELGRLAASCVERLYVMGGMAGAVARGAAAAGLSASTIVKAESHREILEDLLGFIMKGDTVIVKGSRGMRMELVAEGIRTAFRSGVVKGAMN